MDTALASVNRAATLTHRLLAFSARQTLDPRHTDVNQLVGGMTDLFSRTLGPSIQIKVKLESDRMHGGLGLGLAIVRSLVALHGGQVSARSEGKDRGSEFRIELALASTEHAITETHGVGGERAAPATPSNAQRILLVDDNEDAAEMLSVYLIGLGHEVQVAPDSPTALRMAPQFLPQVAILDIGLPGMDGHELARKMRDQNPLAECLLIALTGYGQASDRQRSQEAGFDAHLVKPVDIELLKQVLTRSARG